MNMVMPFYIYNCMMLRKNSSILWTFTDAGIIIQNLESNLFMELDDFQEKIWAFIDGTHTENEIVNYLVVTKNKTTFSKRKKIVQQTIRILKKNSFIIEN